MNLKRLNDTRLRGSFKEFGVRVADSGDVEAAVEHFVAEAGKQDFAEGNYNGNHVVAKKKGDGYEVQIGEDQDSVPSSKALYKLLVNRLSDNPKNDLGDDTNENSFKRDRRKVFGDSRIKHSPRRSYDSYINNGIFR